MHQGKSFLVFSGLENTWLGPSLRTPDNFPNNLIGVPLYAVFCYHRGRKLIGQIKNRLSQFQLRIIEQQKIWEIDSRQGPKIYRELRGMTQAELAQNRYSAAV